MKLLDFLSAKQCDIILYLYKHNNNLTTTCSDLYGSSSDFCSKSTEIFWLLCSIVTIL